MRFDHEVDLTREIAEDVGNLSFVNGKLVETGRVTLHGKVIHFQEVWTPLARSDQSDCRVACRSGDGSAGYAVRVCDHVIAMQQVDRQFSAAAWEYDDGDWRLLFSLGQTASLAALLGSFLTDSLVAPWAMKI